MDGFINKLNELVNDKSFSHYKTVEKVFKNPILSNALEAFRNSTALIKAFETGNKDALKWLLTMKMNPMVQDEDGKTALMVAAECGKRKYVQKNIDNLDLIKLTDNRGENFLFYALRELKQNNKGTSSNMDYIVKLVDCGVDINHTNKLGETALNYLCKYRISEFVFENFLLNFEADPNIPDENGYTPAMYLVQDGRYRELSQLDRRFINYKYVSPNGESIMSVFIKKFYTYDKNKDKIPFENYIRVLKTIVSNEVDFNIPIDQEGNTLLMVMVLVGDGITASFCAKNVKKIDLSMKNKYGENVTSLCYKLQYYGLLSIFENNPTFDYNYRDINYNNNLLIISSIGSPIMVNRILENDINLINEMNSRGENALIVASKINNTGAVNTLLDHGIDVNCKDEKGNTALHYAVEIEKPELIKKGKSPLNLANDYGNKELIEALTNPSETTKPKSSDSKKSKKSVLSTKYTESIKSYLIPYMNDEYSDYKCDRKLDIEKGIIFEERYYERHIDALSIYYRG
ncbi:ankyrin [Neocallimastix californiae]|uniref:Ankyrin n=1 Tax=Neocallimastix californiae TaxID=1754190 RepID=A0A1Y2CI16_9FUNG|nr:ankyrin [Neocallimastix californiae]|eukprot:ORY46693.1 ankyrin [Neocallimastix californiae]